MSIEQARWHLSRAITLVREGTRPATDHAGGPYHYADDRVRDLLAELLHERREEDR